MEDTDVMIESKGVTRSFPLGGGREIEVLHGIDMIVPAGKLTILKGRSGSGKTTLLNLLSALDRPTQGQIYWGEKEIGKATEQEREYLRRKDMGFIFQAVALIPVMNAYENVDFGLRLAQTTEKREERVKECLELVGLKNRMNHMPHMPGEMSGGEQQRVAIARAIAHKPKVIFADEPTGAVEIVQQKS